MTLELKPLGNSCNINCLYCYEEPMRLAGNVRASKTYDLDKMFEVADKGNTKGGYTIFGGEGLLLPIKDLETIFKRSYELYGTSSVQTNGSLINDKHIELFKKYKVGVGISIDGPGELNNLRQSKSKETTEELTQRTMDNIVKLVENKISLGIIVTVHKYNGTKDKLPRLFNFFEWLIGIGITSGNVHMLEVDTTEAHQYKLTEEENTYAFLELAKFFNKDEYKQLSWGPFSEMKKMMENYDNNAVGCVFSSCDVMNTQAVYGVEGNGQKSNCGMVNKEGIEWTKAEGESNYIRDYVLYNTHDDKHDCKGCPYFLLCNGYCTGSAINDDWRNKTYHCKTLKELFGYYEEYAIEKGITPFSLLPYRANLEGIFFDRYLNYNMRTGIEHLI